MSEHKAKLVPGFTRKYGVDKLVYFEEYASILEARARERSLKRWQRAWKIALIEKMNPAMGRFDRRVGFLTRLVSRPSAQAREEPGSRGHRTGRQL